VKIYRLVKNSFLKDLSGEGARLYGGRWNRRGDALLYFSDNLSLCVLELLTRMDYEFITADYSYIEAEISSTLIIKLTESDMPSQKWRSNPPISITQDYGSNWIKEEKSLGMSVPSAVLPNEQNILINPAHPSMSKLKIINRKVLHLDSRVLK
jgi:RES domain-containing protein